MILEENNSQHLLVESNIVFTNDANTWRPNSGLISESAKLPIADSYEN